MKRILIFGLTAISTLLFMVGSSVQAAPAIQIKELNLVFLHGANGTSCAMQLLSDTINLKLPDFIAAYERENPGIKIRVDSMNRCYPNNVDINVWANNIAGSCKSFFHQNNLILIGHSMGGKTALYATANDIGGLQNMVSAVVTINSPVKNLSQYYFTGGADYWSAAWLIPQDHGVVSSLANYDASPDGAWVGKNKHWLALCSAESAPSSPQFDVSGVDPLPRDMDDRIVPISAQYADGADVVYYGEHGHSDFETDPALASYQAEFILRYIFGGTIEYSVLADQGSLKHTAGWFPVSYTWRDTIGEFPIQEGTIVRKNDSFKWQNYEDVVGLSESPEKRSSFEATRASLPGLSALLGADWVSPDNDNDDRLLIETRAAPWSTVKIDWIINGFEEIQGRIRDRYEVCIETGTPFTSIKDANWISDDNINDFRLFIDSEAQGPLRYFEASWKTFSREYASHKIIDEMPVTTE
jgi:pimeloyl-ACP methyl ester carboxylesterase